MSYLKTLAIAQPYLQGAHHFDEKVIEGEVSLRLFIAQMLNHYPWWIRFLYGVRAVFVRFLGMKQEGMPDAMSSLAQKVSFEPNTHYSIFTVVEAEEDRHWFVRVTDQHLSAELLIVSEAVSAERKRFYVGTVVHYQNWAGPIYFNIIRPFHHWVVASMMRAGVSHS